MTGLNPVSVAQPSAFLPVSAARQMLADADTIADVKRLRDQADAIHHLVRRQHHGLARQNEWAEMKLRCERKLGEMLATSVAPRGRCVRDESTGELLGAARTLPDGVTSIQSHRWRLAAGVPEHVFESWLAEIREAGDEVTTVGLVALAKPKDDQDDDGPDDDDDDGPDDDDDDADDHGGYTRSLTFLFSAKERAHVHARLTELAAEYGTDNHSDTLLAALRDLARLKATT